MTHRRHGHLLTVEGLKLSFTRYESGLKKHELNVINDLDLDIHEGEIVSIVGSSGSGKSLLAHAILGILPSNAICEGRITYKGEELTQQRKELLRGREICLIPQSVSYIDPLMKVSKFVQLSVRDKAEARIRQRAVFSEYGLEPYVDEFYPFQLSGGMTRRVLVSTAAITDSQLIIADEPTPGLDKKALDETLAMFSRLRDRGCSILLITHDIEAALEISDRIAIFYAGSTLEIANKSDFSGAGENLRHPYSKALWMALPANGFNPIIGSQPSPLSLPRGCLFGDRCRHCDDDCRETRPTLSEIRNGRVRCTRAHFVHEHAHVHEGADYPHVHRHMHVEEEGGEGSHEA